MLVGDLAGQVLVDQRPGVVGPVDPVAESHDALLVGDLVLDELLRGLGGGDILQVLHDLHPRTPVEGPDEGADAGDDSGVEIGKRGGRDPGREGRRVQLVLGGYDEVGLDGPRLQVRGPLAPEHVEEVRPVGQRRVRWHDVLALVNPPEGRDDGGELGDPPYGLADVRLKGAVLEVNVAVGLEGDGGPKGVHRLDVEVAGPYDLEHAAIDAPLRPEARRPFGQLIHAGKVPEQEQVGDGLVIQVRQFPDVVAPVLQIPLVAVDVADPGREHLDAFESLLHLIQSFTSSIEESLRSQRDLHNDCFDLYHSPQGAGPRGVLAPTGPIRADARSFAIFDTIK